MKTISKNLFWAAWSNPINRNLILIMVAALAIATFLVTAGIIVYYHW
jgi:hypothetical protein